MPVRLRWRDSGKRKSHYGPIRFGEDGMSVETYPGDASDYALKVSPAQRRRRDRRVGLLMYQALFRNSIEIVDASPPAAKPAEAAKAPKANGNPPAPATAAVKTPAVPAAPPPTPSAQPPGPAAKTASQSQVQPAAKPAEAAKAPPKPTVKGKAGKA